MKRTNQTDINTPERFNEVFAAAEISKGIERLSPNRQNFMSQGIYDGANVIELGCGNSPMLINIKKKFPNCHCVGLDFCPDVLKFMHKNHPEIEYILGDCLKTPFLDNSFNFVLAGELLEHVQEPSLLIKEMNRLCCPEGYIGLSTPNAEGRLRGSYDSFHLWEFELQDIIDLLSPFGKVEAKIVQDGWSFIVARCWVTKKEV